MNVRSIKTSFLKLTVDVAGEDAAAVLHFFRPMLQDFKATVRNRFAIQRQTMAIEAPGLFGCGMKRCG